MEDIVITQSSLLEIINELQIEKDNIENYINEMGNELENINNAWKGADATKYISKMKDDYSEQLTTLKDDLATYIEYLKQVYPQYEKLDSKYQGINIEV